MTYGLHKAAYCKQLRFGSLLRTVCGCMRLPKSGSSGFGAPLGMITAAWHCHWHTAAGLRFIHTLNAQVGLHEAAAAVVQQAAEVLEASYELCMLYGLC